MDPVVQRALSRLRDADSSALHDLAQLVVQESTNTPLKDLAEPRWIASQIATALEAATHKEMARDWTRRRIADVRERAQDETRPLRTWMPEEVDGPLRELLGREYSPNPDLVFRIVDHPSIRKLISEVLEDTVRRFWKRTRNLDSGLIGGATKRAVRRGRGLGRSLLGGVASNLAESVVGAVTDEMEHALDKRLHEFIDQATTRALRSIVEHLCNPEEAEDVGHFRVAILDAVLDTSVADLGKEMDKTSPEEVVDLVVQAIRSIVAEDDFVDRTEAGVQRLLDEAGDGTLGAWLEEVGLLQVWSDTTAELVTERLQAVVATDAFSDWWASLFADPATSEAG